MEAVLPIEIEIPSHLISLERQLPEEERHRERLAQLEWLDEKRLRAAHHAQIYQRRIYHNDGLGAPLFSRRSGSEEDFSLCCTRSLGQTGKDHMSSPRFTLGMHIE